MKQEAIIASHGGTYPRSAALPEVGRFKHTTKATPYALENGVFLVDFPGSDGSKTYAQQWLDYTALPSFVVLLLKYEVSYLFILSNLIILSPGLFLKCRIQMLV